MTETPAHDSDTPRDSEVSDTTSETRSQRPSSPAFREFIASQWAPAETTPVPPLDSSPYARARRAALGAQFPGQRLVVPAGGLKVRSNDTDYPYRPHSAFAHLTGLGTDEEVDAVLVLEPDSDADGGHGATLYFRPLAPRTSEQFYADARHGEFWVGPRATLEAMEQRTGLTCEPLEKLADAVVKDVPGTQVRVLSDVDASLTALIDSARGHDETGDAELERAVSELRLIKDEWEISQLQQAVDASIRGFDDVVRALPEAITATRGERVVDGVFAARARIEGNQTGYDTIAASGNNATVLHWTRNNGAVRRGDLILVDAGVEVDSLYTADITRTLPVSGTFTDIQRQIYTAVLDAADAALEIVRPGIRFRDVHATAMEVIAQRLEAWGLLPVSADVALSSEGGQHRRWMPHGTSHHLGIDVHDCAQARREMYLDAVIEPGMVFTIEPGLYFKTDDLAVPEEYRGIGVRIEDDILVTSDGARNMSAALPRTPDAVERWMAELLPPTR